MAAASRWTLAQCGPAEPNVAAISSVNRRELTPGGIDDRQCSSERRHKRVKWRWSIGLERVEKDDEDRRIS